MYQIALIRSASSAVSRNQYNIQEIGMAKELVSRGFNVDVFLISDKNETYTEVISASNELKVYWLKGYKIPGQQGYYPDLIKILCSKNYDLIQALDDSQITTILVSRFCKKNNINFVLWQGMYENYPETYKKIIQYFFDRTFLKMLRKTTNYCIAKTSAAREYLISKNFNNIKVIPVGLEISNFKNSKKIDYFKKLKIPQKNKVFLYVGKVEQRRNPIFCLKLFSLIVKKHPDSTLIYVGKGPMEEVVRKYSTENEIPNVIFIDKVPQDELPSLYQLSHLFLLPTRYEIFGMVLMEAMYFGTPVITYKAAGPNDVIDNGIDGIIMNNFDVIEWSIAIEKMVYENPSFDRMGQIAMHKIREKYLWNSVGRLYAEAYHQILS